MWFRDHSIIMGIPLPQLLGKTPDVLQSVNEDSDVQDEKLTNKFEWHLRSTKREGLHVKVNPKIHEDGTEWVVEIFDVEWNGEDFIENPRERESHAHSSFTDAVSCAEQKTREICEGSDKLSWILG